MRTKVIAQAVVVSPASEVFHRIADSWSENLPYSRKAHTFNKKRAQRVPKMGYRVDVSAVYRKGNSRKTDETFSVLEELELLTSDLRGYAS